MSARDDWRPTASLERLAARAELLGVLRDVFLRAGYWEVETPILSAEVGVDEHLEPFVTRANDGSERFLQTSPEFGMKRLLAAGARMIYQVTRAFRRDESGPRHNPEFTMIEWYGVGTQYHEQMDFVEQLVRQVATSSSPRPDWLIEQPFPRLTYDQAFERVLETTVLELSIEELVGLARRKVPEIPVGLEADDRDGWLNLLLAETVEPTMGQCGPEFLFHYPASQAALARVRPGTPPVAERFELFVKGIEVCNGYQELTDAEELARRTREQADIRQRRGQRPLPVTGRLEEAQRSGLPDCSGVALGWDRLVMLVLGAECLEDVMAFPFPRA